MVFAKNIQSNHNSDYLKNNIKYCDIKRPAGRDKSVTNYFLICHKSDSFRHSWVQSYQIQSGHGQFNISKNKNKKTKNRN